MTPREKINNADALSTFVNRMDLICEAIGASTPGAATAPGALAGTRRRTIQLAGASVLCLDPPRQPASTHPPRTEASGAALPSQTFARLARYLMRLNGVMPTPPLWFCRGPTSRGGAAFGLEHPRTGFLSLRPPQKIHSSRTMRFFSSGAPSPQNWRWSALAMWLERRLAGGALSPSGRQYPPTPLSTVHWI